MRRKMLLSYFSILLAFCAVIFVFVLRTVYSAGPPSYPTPWALPAATY